MNTTRKPIYMKSPTLLIFAFLLALFLIVASIVELEPEYLKIAGMAGVLFGIFMAGKEKQ